MKNVLSVILLSLFACFQIHASPENVEQQLASLLNNLQQDGKFNGVLMVDINQNNQFSFAVGYTDGSRSKALNTDSTFALGSITKEFSAVSLMMLVEQDKIKLDDRLSEYFPQLPKWSTQIQIKHLLNYTSGLPKVNFRKINKAEDIDLQLNTVKELAFTPGEGYLYSNHNVFLQIKLIEKVSDKPYTDFLQQQILQPLGMSSSYLNNYKPSSLVLSFNKKFKNDPILEFPVPAMLHSNVSDMRKWLYGLHHQKLIKNKSLNTLFESFDEYSQSALGAGKYNDGELTEHRHQGSNFNFESQIYFNKTTNLTIILLTNQKNRNLKDINNKIKEIVSPLVINNN